MNKHINEQQELLRKAFNKKLKSLGLAAIEREVGERSTDYGISFYTKKGNKIVPDIGIQIKIYRSGNLLGSEKLCGYNIDIKPCKVKIESGNNLPDMTVEKCLQKYRHFVIEGQERWVDALFEIKDVALLAHCNYLAGKGDPDDIVYMSELLLEVIPQFCYHINKGDFSYEW